MRRGPCEGDVQEKQDFEMPRVGFEKTLRSIWLGCTEVANAWVARAVDLEPRVANRSHLKDSRHEPRSATDPQP